MTAAAGGSAVELSIIVPCYNEAENVVELAERAQAMFEAHGLAGEVVFVDDCSTDHTGALIDDLAARHGFVRGVHHTQNKGMPGGWQSGVEAARGRYVAIMDGDLQYLPEDVYRLYRQLRHSHADIVQGWRSHIGRPRDFRYTMSRVLHHMLRVLFGLRLHDIKSGFLVCDRDIFAHILRRRFSYAYFQTFIVISAHHKGYRIEEIESLFEERKLGESFISAFPLTMIVKNLVDVAKGFVEFRLLGRRTDVLGDFLIDNPVPRPPDPLSLLRRLRLRLFAALMPVHHWKLSSAALRYFYQLRRTQWLSTEQIRALQDARLRSLINHAYRHVPYYREMLDRLGIDPEQIRRIEDLQRLPVLSKDTVRRTLHFDLMSATHDKRQMLPVTTSGATGEPLTLYADRMHLEMRWATALRNREWTGYRFGDRQVRLWDIDLGRPRLQALRDRLDALLSRRTAATAITMTADGLRRAAALARRHPRTLVSGDAAALNLIASASGGSGAAEPTPLAVVSSEQTLTPALRAAIEQGFGAPLFDQYATRELGTVAHECGAHRGLHVNAESYIVEVLRDGRPARPGESGAVVITDLSNLSVPLIRYAIGDRATLSDRRCACGRGLPLIEAIDGRAPTMIVGADGSFVPGTYFAQALSDYGHVIRQFQVVQSEPGALHLRIVKGPRFSDAALRRLLDLFHQHLGSGIAIAVEAVVRIRPVDSEPHAPVVSQVSLGTARLDGPRAAPARAPHAPLDDVPAPKR
jgi:phenylacetate-CoA ligase